MVAKDKLKALVHFIVHECRDNPGQLGAVRLNKALWFTDMLAYQEIGTSVTGARYIKRKMGPVPKAVLPTLRELQEESKIVIQERTNYYDSRKFISILDPDVSLLSDSDRQTARAVLNFVCNNTANEISDITHDEVWRAAMEGEEIPLVATLATGRGAITKDTKKWAGEIVREIEDDKTEVA